MLIMDETAMTSLPGGELIREGLRDLAGGRETVEALLVSIGEPRLRRIGLDIKQALPDPETRLYKHLAREHGNSAHSKYNSYIRLLVSFERAAECAR